MRVNENNDSEEKKALLAAKSRIHKKLFTKEELEHFRQLEEEEKGKGRTRRIILK